MSTILDALRRKSGDRQTDDYYEQTAGTDAVLATLGRSQSQSPQSPSRARRSIKTLVIWGAAAIAIGFAGVSLLILTFTPPTPPGTEPRRSLAASKPPATRMLSPVLRAPESPLQRTSVAPPVEVSRPVPPPSALATSESEPRPTARAAMERREPPAADAPHALSARPAQDADPAVDALARPAVVRRARPEPESVAARVMPSRMPSAMSSTMPSAMSATPQSQPPSPLPSSPPSVPTVQPAIDHFGLALYDQRTGDFDAALSHYRTLLEQNDGSAEVHNNLGLLYQGQDQFDDAIKQFQRAIAINPKYGKAHNNLGVALMRSGQTAQAAAEFRVALTDDPRNVEALVNLALTQRAGGRPAEARDLLQRAIAIDPRNAGTHYNLAVAADLSGDTAIAIEHYRAFLRLAFLRLGTVGPTDLGARVRARLTVLGG